jgi:hypothetical protein
MSRGAKKAMRRQRRENLHRQDLTPEEAALQRAEYARLSAVERGEIPPDAELSQLGSISPGRGNTGGIRASGLALGIPNTTLQRDIIIAGLRPARQIGDVVHEAKRKPGAYKDVEARKAYRREWMAARRAVVHKPAHKAVVH